jgi:hypothetical protein
LTVIKETKLRKSSATKQTTLHARLIAYENDRHARRLAEIKSVATKLRMFEPTAAALEARGIYLSRDSYLNASSDKALHLQAGGFITIDEGRLYNALTELGYTEIERSEHSNYATCLMKQGRLTVALSIPAGHTYSPPAKPEVQTSAHQER